MSKVVKKLILGLGTISLGVISLGVIATCLYTESYFPLYPLIDTRLPPNFNQSFHTVIPGMSATAVESLLGQPRSESSTYQEELHEVFQQSSGAVKSCWQYGTDGAAWNGDFAWLSYNVCFGSEDQVVKTGVAIYHD